MQITRGRVGGAQKIVVYGPEGIGKSTFAAQFPDPIFIDTEGSTKEMDVARTPRPISWYLLNTQIQYFLQHTDELKTLVIDTVDWAEQLCAAEICEKAKKKGIEDFGYGKGYVYLAEEFGNLLRHLGTLVERGVNVVLTAHAQMRKFEQPDEMGAYDRWELKLGKKTAPLVKEWADMVLFANYKTYVVNVDGQGAEKGRNKAQGGSRVIYTTHHPCWDAKNRHNLPDELPFQYDSISRCIVSGAPEVPAPLVSEPTKMPTPTVTEYWADSLTDKVYKVEPGEELPPMEGLALQVEKEDYAEYIKSAAVSAKPAGDALPPKDGIPPALSSLMYEHKVTEDQIREAVAGKGYYPADTPIAKYDPDFIADVLVCAWDQVYAMIQDNDLPFTMN